MEATPSDSLRITPYFLLHHLLMQPSLFIISYSFLKLTLTPLPPFWPKYRLSWSLTTLAKKLYPSVWPPILFRAGQASTHTVQIIMPSRPVHPAHWYILCKWIFLKHSLDQVTPQFKTLQWLPIASRVKRKCLNLHTGFVITLNLLSYKLR